VAASGRGKIGVPLLQAAGEAESRSTLISIGNYMNYVIRCVFILFVHTYDISKTDGKGPSVWPNRPPSVVCGGPKKKKKYIFSGARLACGISFS
jgi:hypothetical protein